jgi:hypothetical protein
MNTQDDEDDDKTIAEAMAKFKAHPFNPDGEGNLDVPLEKSDGTILTIAKGDADADTDETTESEK